MRKKSFLGLALVIAGVLTAGILFPALSPRTGEAASPQPVAATAQTQSPLTSEIGIRQGCYWLTVKPIYNPYDLAKTLGMPPGLPVCIEAAFPGDPVASTITITGMAPWADINGTMLSDGTFEGTGHGPMATYPDLAMEAKGRVVADTVLTLDGSYQVGVEGELPGGQVVSFRIQGQQLRQADLNCDGKIDLLDALTVLQGVAGAPQSQNGPCPGINQLVGFPWGDIDCSGAATLIDAMKLLLYAAGNAPAQNQGCLAFGEVIMHL